MKQDKWQSVEQPNQLSLCLLLTGPWHYAFSIKADTQIANVTVLLTTSRNHFGLTHWLSTILGRGFELGCVLRSTPQSSMPLVENSDHCLHIPYQVISYKSDKDAGQHTNICLGVPDNGHTYFIAQQCSQQRIDYPAPLGPPLTLIGLVMTRCTATGHVTPICIYIVPTGELWFFSWNHNHDTLGLLPE